MVEWVSVRELKFVGCSFSNIRSRLALSAKALGRNNLPHVIRLSAVNLATWTLMLRDWDEFTTSMTSPYHLLSLSHAKIEQECKSEWQAAPLSIDFQAAKPTLQANCVYRTK